jgi:hypothetical protein
MIDVDDVFVAVAGPDSPAADATKPELMADCPNR